MRKWLILLLIVLTSCCAVETKEDLVPPRTYLYQNITMEIQPTTAVGVVSSQLSLLKDRLHEYRICRRDNISVVIRPAMTTQVSWLRHHIVAFKNRNRTLFDRNPDDNHLIVFISVLPGGYLEHGKRNVIGLAFADQHIALFNNFDFYVLLHEFGHVIGLVNRDYREEDPVNEDRPRHCNIRSCVMFWRVNKWGRFDDRCLADISRMIDKRNHNNERNGQ